MSYAAMHSVASNTSRSPDFVFASPPCRWSSISMRQKSQHALPASSHPSASLVLDTSHAAVADHDPVAVRQRFGPRVRHVHLSDNAGRGWDSHLPPGQGVLDLDTFCEDLADDGYEGAVSLEVDLRTHLTDPVRLREVMVSMRERAERLLRISPDPT